MQNSAENSNNPELGFDNPMETIAGPNTQKPRRTRAERLGRFAKRATRLASSESETSGQSEIESALDQMIPRAALEFLKHANGQLRRGGGRKSEVYGDSTSRVMVGGYSMYGGMEMVAPDPWLQQDLLSEYLEAIKKTESGKKKATLAYYAINNLHLFEDGNGRTSRAIYYLIKKGRLSNYDNDIVSHTPSESPFVRGPMNDTDDGFGRNTFLDDEGIQPIELANTLANRYLQSELCNEGSLDVRMRDKHIFVFSVAKIGGLVGIPMTEENAERLHDEELMQLGFAMSDGCSNTTTLAGLTLASVLCKRGQADRVLKMGLHDDGRLALRINFNEDSTEQQIADVRETFADWQADDYRALLSTYRDLKKRQNEMIMRFFTEDLKFDDGEKVSDYLCGINNREDEEHKDA